MNTRCIINEHCVTHIHMESDDTIREYLVRQSREWLREVIESTGKTPNAIAKKAGVSVANLGKLLNQADWPHPLSETVKLKISRAWDVPLPGAPMATPKKESRGFAEPEAVRYRPEPGQMLPQATGNGLDWWELRTNFLDLEGLLPGDKVLIDLNRPAKNNDIVIAQLTVESGRVETIIRKFEAPMLTCHSTSRVYPRPEFVDGERVIIMGVVAEARRKMHPVAA